MICLFTLWAQHNNCVPFFASAVTGDGIDEMFQQAATTLFMAIKERAPAVAQNMAQVDEKTCC
jgi:hypothetical protein